MTEDALKLVVAADPHLTLLTLLGSIDGKVNILVERSASHDRRISSVERRQWFSSGAIAFAVAMLVPQFKAMFGLPPGG